MTKRNLILIHRGPEYERDFDEIAATVNAIDKDITVYHLPASLRVELPVSAWQYPTLTVALTSQFKLPIRRGPIFKAEAYQKLTQQEIFWKNGIPTPPAARFSIGLKLDPILFGEFVVLKTIDLTQTSKGNGVFLFRRRRLDALSPSNIAGIPKVLRRGGTFIVQKFIDTGSFPNHFRVQTFFGEVIYSWKQVLENRRPSLDSPDDVLEAAVVASQGGDRSFRLNYDSDVLELARQVHKCFPNIPMLGVDIVRDCNSERLYVLECNAGGNTWHFSSAMGETLRLKLSNGSSESGRQMLMEQFNAFDLVSRALVYQTMNNAC